MNFETGLSDITGRRARTFRFRPTALVLAPLAAILFQVYVPRFLPALSYLELPLLVTVYFALMKRQPVAGSFIGCGVGLVQDALSHHPLGLFGIVKTLVGYFAGSVSQRFDVQNPALRFILSFFFVLFHQLFFWMLTRALLGQLLEISVPQTIIFSFLNAVVALPLYMVLDKLRDEGR